MPAFETLRNACPSRDTTCPTNNFTISEPQDQEIGEFNLVQKRRAADYEAPKL